MLTDKQRLTFRDIKEGKLNPKQKGDFYYRVSKILKEELEGLEDIANLLDELPDSYLEKINLSKTAGLAMRLAEKIIEKLDPYKALPSMLDLVESTLDQLGLWPIGEHEEGGLRAFRVLGNTIPMSPDSEPGKCTIDSISRPASEEEIYLNHRLAEHFSKIRFYVDPCIPDPIPHDPDYLRTQEEKAFEIAKKIAAQRHESLGVSFNAYFDEWVGEDQWVYRKPFLVDIEKLKFMRLRPDGLMKCMEHPPLLAPKKVPRGHTIMSLSIHSNNNGTQFLVSEEGGEARSVPFEEFLEYQKKFGIRADLGRKETIKPLSERADSSTTNEGKEEPK